MVLIIRSLTISCSTTLWEQVPYADALNHRADSQAYLDYSMEDQAVIFWILSQLAFEVEANNDKYLRLIKRLVGIAKLFSV